MRYALVTGPSSGIGREVALEMGRLGFHVIAAGRSKSGVGAVVDDVRANGGTAEFLHLDLTSLESVRIAASNFEETARPLDVLINNAGVGVRRGTTDDGFQLQFGVNHLGHFMLTRHLRRTFSPGARVVNVSSNMHYRATGLDFDRVTRSARAFEGIDAYARSKLANVLFTRELARKQPAWRSYAVHPGVVETAIFPAVTRHLVRSRSITPKEASDTVVWCATDPTLADSSGRYYAKRTEREPSEWALDDNLANELWDRSEEWCGVGSVE